MADWPPSEIFPSRSKPHRLPREEYQRVLQPVFFAACTRRRKPVLLDRGMGRVLRALLDGNASRRGCEVIAYTFMPDHLHVIACVVRAGGDVLLFFEDFKRGAANAALRAGLGHVWQRDFWDRHTRNARDLTRCVEYVMLNPVVEGLCERPEDWPYSEFRGYPRVPRLTNDNDRARA